MDQMGWQAVFYVAAVLFAFVHYAWPKRIEGPCQYHPNMDTCAHRKK